MLLRKLHLENTALTRRVRRAVGLSLLSAGLLTSLTPVAKANITGSDTQNFNPTFSGHDFITVYSSKTLGAGNYSLGLFANYAVNTLPYFLQKDERNDTSKSYNDALTTVDVGVGFGLFDNLDIGLMAPSVVHQHVTDKEGYHGQFGETGNTEIRLGAKFRLWHNDRTGIALVGSVNFNRIQDNPYSGKDAGASFNGEIVADHRFGESLTVAANAGYRFRQAGDVMTDPFGNKPITPVDSQIIASAAVKYRFNSTGTNLIGEVYGAQPGEEISEFSPRQASVYEWIGGLKQEFADDFAFHIGAGGEVVHSVSSPDVRVYTGINWTPAEKKPVVQRKPQPKPQPKVVKRVVNKVVKQVVVVKPQAAPRQPDEQIILRDVLFKFNSADLDHPSASKSLNDLARLITGPKGLDQMIIEGHTCSIGSDQSNLDLSVRRANAIKNWLVTTYKVDPNKVIAIGHGESRPIATNATPAGRRLNRRVEFKIYHARKPELAQGK